MFRCAVGQAEGLDGSLLIEQVLAQCDVQRNGAVPQAGILIASGRYDFAAILRRVTAHHPGIKLVGCSTAGDATSQLGFSEDSLALLLFLSDEIGFSVGVIRPDQPDATAELGRACAEDARTPSLCLVFPTGFNLDSDSLIEMLEPILPSGCALFGGRAAVATGSRYDYLVQFCGTEVLRDAASFLLIHDDGKLHVAFSVSNVWSPVGSRQRVTQSQGQSVMRIGERSALEYYRHYLGPHSRPAAEFPLAVFEEDGQHYYLRVAQAFDPQTGAVVHAARVKEGSLVQLTEAVRSTMLQDIARGTTQALAELKRQPALALMISCAARKSILGTRLDEERLLVESRLPAAVPVFGYDPIAGRQNARISRASGGVRRGAQASR